MAAIEAPLAIVHAIHVFVGITGLRSEGHLKIWGENDIRVTLECTLVATG